MISKGFRLVKPGEFAGVKFPTVQCIRFQKASSESLIHLWKSTGRGKIEAKGTTYLSLSTVSLAKFK